MIDHKTQRKLELHKSVEFKAKIGGLYCRLLLWGDVKGYFVSLIIHKSRRLANDWTRKESDKYQFHPSCKTTGNGEIRGLLWAKNILVQLGERYNIFIEGESEKHLRAYKWLTRYDWHYHHDRLISPCAKRKYEDQRQEYQIGESQMEYRN